MMNEPHLMCHETLENELCIAIKRKLRERMVEFNKLNEEYEKATGRLVEFLSEIAVGNR